MILQHDKTMGKRKQILKILSNDINYKKANDRAFLFCQREREI